MSIMVILCEAFNLFQYFFCMLKDMVNQFSFKKQKKASLSLSLSLSEQALNTEKNVH